MAQRRNGPVHPIGAKGDGAFDLPVRRYLSLQGDSLWIVGIWVEQIVSHRPRHWGWSFRFIRIWTTPPNRLVSFGLFWDGAPSPSGRLVELLNSDIPFTAGTQTWKVCNLIQNGS